MVTVVVQILPYFASLIAHQTRKLDLLREIDEGSTVEDVLNDLSKEYSSQYKEEIYDPETRALNEMVMIILNGHLLHALQGLETVLRQDDVIVIAPLSVGG